MNISESRSVTEICRMLNNSPFPEEAVAHLEFLLDRARMALGACVPDPTPVPMHEQFALEVHFGSVGWHIDPNVGDAGWVDAEVYLEGVKRKWAPYRAPYPETRVLTRWVSEPEVRA